jgi:hypothetical protein
MADHLTILLACYSLQVMFGSLTILGALALGNLLTGIVARRMKARRRILARQANLAAWRNRRAMRVLRGED